MTAKRPAGGPTASTMMTEPLLVSSIFRHGMRVHGHSRVHTYDGTDLRALTFRDVAGRVERLARGLPALGITQGSAICTLMWNTHEHLELYFAVPGIGAVLHTANPRVRPEHLILALERAGDEVIVVHHSLVPILTGVLAKLTTVLAFVLVDDGVPVAEADLALLTRRAPLHHYEQMLREPGAYTWPQFDEQAPATICFTSGTTGDPKGVVYSHRSSWLHTFAVNNNGTFAVTEADSFLVVVPMFHVNAWGYPYVAWLTGADIVLPGRHTAAADLAVMIKAARVTLSAAVPTVWHSLLTLAEHDPGVDLTTIRHLNAGGSAVPVSMIERFARLGVDVVQGWGMTEMSPIGAVAGPPADAPDPTHSRWRAKTGRLLPGVDLRIMLETGSEAPWDGQTVGEIQVRGPWITGSYLAGEQPESFVDGWFRTFDIGHVDDHGYLVITDRLKDVIKSGGEWISSVALENELAAHPGVIEACVVAVPDERWGERPLAVIVAGASAPSATELHSWLFERLPKSWVPEYWAFVEQIARTSVGKYDKLQLRTAASGGDLPIEIQRRTVTHPGNPNAL